MFEELLAKKKSIAVIGLGYVGLPLALEFARKFKVIGINPLTIEPLDPIRFPQRYSVMLVLPSSADAPAPKPVEPAD